MLRVHFGMGRHATTLDDPASFAKVRIQAHDSLFSFTLDSLIASKSVLALEVIYNASIVTTKLSILLLYHRIFPSRKFRYVLWAVGTFVVCYSITASMVNIFQCVPVRSDWDPTVKAKCVNIGLDLIILSSINVVTDAAILCLPIQQIWNLKMSWIRKTQIAGLFLLGALYENLVLSRLRIRER